MLIRRVRDGLIRSRVWTGRVLLIGLVLGLAACGRETPRLDLPLPEGLTARQAAFADLPGWESDRLAEAIPALQRSCDRLRARPDDAGVGPNGFAGSVADWQAPCDAIRGLADGDGAALRRLLQAQFVPLALSAESGAKGLFTGYYEATLDAARQRHGPYQHPLYRKPGDLITARLGRFRADLEGERVIGRVAGQELVPYYTRVEIAEGALSGRDLELLWSDDPVDVFFLHVQGSGVAQLPDGKSQRVGFAASNGHEFTAIGRELIRRGVLDSKDMSMQAIRDWLRANPEQADALMALNKRYIFFRDIDGAGPIGAQGVALTAGRSLAVDPAFLPLGAPLWLATREPGAQEPFRRLMVAQDTGSAIKGPIRGDIFFGHGEPALARAGRMKEPGRLWLLLPKGVVAGTA